MKNKKYYKTVLMIVKEYNLTVIDSLNLKITDGIVHNDKLDLEYDLKDIEIKNESDLFYKLIFLDVTINKLNFNTALEYILELECYYQNEIIIYFTILKRITLQFGYFAKPLLKKCKKHLPNTSIRSIINKILSAYVDEEYFYNVIDATLIVKYNLWNKSHLLTLSEVKNFIKNRTLIKSSSNNKTISYVIRLNLTRVFFSLVNSTSFKYINKCYLDYEKEYFVFLPVTYSKIGYSNLDNIFRSLGKDYKDYVIRYINKHNPLQILFDVRNKKKGFLYNEDEVVRAGYLKFINTYEELEEFLIYNQFFEHSKVIFFKNFKDALNRLTIGKNNFLRLYNNIIHNMCMSPITDRRFLGCKILCYLVQQNFLDIQGCETDIKNLIFDKNIEIRKEAKFLFRNIKLSMKEKRDIVFGDNINNFNIILNDLEMNTINVPRDCSEVIDILKNRKNISGVSHLPCEERITVEEIIGEFKKRLEYFIKENYEKIVRNPINCLLRLIYRKNIYDMNLVHLYLSEIALGKSTAMIEDDIVRYKYKSILNKILKENCVYFYENKDYNSLIRILLKTQDLGILIEIENYLTEMFKKLDDLDYKKIIDFVVEDISSISFRIRRSGGYGIIFKCILKNIKNFHSNLSYILGIFFYGGKSHLMYDKDTSTKNKSKPNKVNDEDIEYHYSNVVLSLIEEYDILSVKSLFSLCFLESKRWIVKNNSIKIFKILYKKYIDSLELRYLIFEYANEVITRDNYDDCTFIYLILLVYEQYDELNKEEIKIIDIFTEYKGFIGLKSREIKYKNEKKYDKYQSYQHTDILLFDSNSDNFYNLNVKEIYQDVKELKCLELFRMLSVLSKDHKKYKISREFFHSLIVKEIFINGYKEDLYEFIKKVGCNKSEGYDSHYLRLILKNYIITNNL